MKHRFVLNAISRRLAIKAVQEAPDGHVVKIGEQTRSLDQNAKLWPMLSDVAKQVQWPVDGRLVYMHEDDWKDLFTAALRKHQRMAKGIDGGVVMLGGRTSRMVKAEFSDLIELIYSFGAEHGVQWSEPPAKVEEGRRAA
jgi:hypothetical protein